MHASVKKVLGLLENHDFNSHELWGDRISSAMFTKYAILSRGSGKVCVLSNKDSDVHSFLLRLTQIVYSIGQLEKEGSLLVINHKLSETEPYLFYNQKTLFLTSVKASYYDVGNGIELFIDDENFSCSLLRGYQCLLKGEIIDINPFYEQVLYYLTSEIIPTTGFTEYVDRGYKTREEKALSQSKKSIWIAILIGVFSPLLTLLVSGLFDKSSQKFDIRCSEPIHVVVDSILSQQDTLNNSTIIQE